MKEQLLKNIADDASGYHKSGFNCAETIFLTFRKYVSPELSEEMVRLATPFGGGMGRSGCVCGTLSGSMMIIGAAKGRVSPDIPRKISYEPANEFHDIFRKKFGATCCRVLVKDEFGTPGQAERCNYIITESAVLLLNFLVERGIVAEDSCDKKAL